MRKCRLTVTAVIRYHPGRSGCPDQAPTRRALGPAVTLPVVPLHNCSVAAGGVRWPDWVKERKREGCSVTNRCARQAATFQKCTVVWQCGAIMSSFLVSLLIRSIGLPELHLHVVVVLRFPFFP